MAILRASGGGMRRETAMTFVVRALELHGSHIWRRSAVQQALEFITCNGLNTLVLHETDLVQMVTYPRSYLDPHGLWHSAPTRRGENAIENNRVYLDHVMRLADKAGVSLLVEVKEIGFPDEILALKPELMKQGEVCPSDPFWLEFIERKTDEFFTDFPQIAGMISSAGSTEGKASRAQNKCGCSLCRQTTLEDWYFGIISALHRASARHGRLLAVRDFAYKPEDHAPLLRAIERAPSDVVVCAKVTPHDFYPTFPDNPAIAGRGRPQWIEYDTMGQFYGWGLFPCLVLDDLRSRLAHAARNAVTGVSFRVEWERINDYWSLDGLNAMNAIAGAALANGETIDAEEVCRRWLAFHELPEAAAGWLAGIMQRTWPIIRGALFMDDFVFADNSMYPRSLRRAWWGMEVRDALQTWDPSRASALRIDRSRLEELLVEKRQAEDDANALAADVRKGHPSLPPALHAILTETFDRYALYIAGFRACADVCLRARWLDPAHRNDAGPQAADLVLFQKALDTLDAFAERIRAVTEDAALPHQMAMLMDYRRAADIAREGRALLQQAAGS
jgi:hypothetical protein